MSPMPAKDNKGNQQIASRRAKTCDIGHGFGEARNIQSAGKYVGRKEEDSNAATEFRAKSSANHICL
jgi:hypothetical protein